MVNYTRRFAATESGESCFRRHNWHRFSIMLMAVATKLVLKLLVMAKLCMILKWLVQTRERNQETLYSSIPSNKSFKITKPGTWKVTVESLSSHAECATPDLR